MTYTRRRMLTWTAGAMAAATPARAQSSQLTSEQQRLLACYPRYGEPVTYTDERLRCLEAELQRHIPISFEAVPGARATSIISETRQNGRTRFVIGNNEDVFGLFESFSSSATSTEEILEAASQIDARLWLESESLYREDDSTESLVPGSGILPPDLEFLLRQLPSSDVIVLNVAEPSNAASSQFRAVRDSRTGGFKPEVVIATLNESDWTNAPALLKYGGWNACPPPEVHVAVHRYWRERYSIELVSAQMDTLEFRVASPPRDRETALALAREQYAYCNDIVDQGVGTLANLAATLTESDYWFFWWD